MTYRIPLPAGGRRATLDLVDGTSTSVQRSVRRNGLGGYESTTCSTILTLADLADPGFVMFDVGCNMGLYSSLVAAMFEPGAVHGFEPAGTTAEIARRIARANRLSIEVHEMALSDSIGWATLYLSPVSDASNSLVEGFRETTESQQVQTSTLDRFVELHGVSPNILKLDVETHERSVLDGARATIERHRPAIVVEVLRRRGRDHGVEIDEFFDGLGYTYYELSAEPDWEPKPKIRGNGTADRDWLVVPEPLVPDFRTRWIEWRNRLGACSAADNPSLSVAARATGAFRRGGFSEVWAGIRSRLQT